MRNVCDKIPAKLLNYIKSTNDITVPEKALKVIILVSIHVVGTLFIHMCLLLEHSFTQYKFYESPFHGHLKFIYARGNTKSVISLRILTGHINSSAVTIECRWI